MTTGVTLAFPMMQKIIVCDILKLHFSKILWRDIFTIVNGTKLGSHSPNSTSFYPLLIGYSSIFCHIGFKLLPWHTYINSSLET